MGTLQLPQYQPQQIESDRSQRQLDVSGQVALGRSQSNLIGTALEGLDVLAGIAGKIRGQKIADEENAARLKYKQGTTTKMTELETNPISTPQEEYQSRGQGLLDETAPIMQDLPNHKAFVEYRKQLVEDINGGFKYDEARKRFQLWADGAFVAEQDAILTWDINKTREILLDNFDEELIQAVELRDSGLALDLAKSGLEAGTISQKQYDDYLDDGFQKIAARGAIMYARSLGYEQGLKWLSNPGNLSWQTHKGEDRRLSLLQQEDLVKILQSEWDTARRAELEQRRRITYSTDNEYLDKLVNNNLSIPFIMGDSRSLAYDGQPYSLREKYIGILEKRAEEALKGGKPPGEEDGYLTSEVRLRYLDHNVTPEDFRTWLKANTGYDGDGKLKIHEKLAVQFTDKADGKPLSPNISYGRVRLKEFFEKQASMKEAKKDLAGADRDRKEFNQSLSDFVRYLDNPDVAKELLRSPKLIDEWVTNRTQKMVDDQVGKWLSGVVLRPEALRGGSFVAPLTEGERLQRTVQEGRITGREQEFSPQLGQYEEGVRRAAVQDLGREPDYRKRFPGGQLHLYYKAPEGVDSKYLYDGDTLIFTYLEEGAELGLKVWNGRMERWETPPAEISMLWKAAPPAAPPREPVLRPQRPAEEMEQQRKSEEEGALRRKRLLERARPR